MIWEWIKSRPLSISKTWTGSWPSAGKDKCLIPTCGIERQLHSGLDHLFMESE